MDWSALSQVAQDLLKSPWFKFFATLSAIASAIAAYLKLIDSVYQWRRNRAASFLEKKMAMTAGVSAYTEADIANACRSYIEPNCTPIDPSDEDDLRNVVALSALFQTVEEHLSREGRHIILLADSGMGKTSFCINYYARELKKKKRYEIELR